MATLAENRQQALDWVNAQRTEWGLPTLDELPKGRQGHGKECVLGRACAGRFFFHGDSHMYHPKKEYFMFSSYDIRGARVRLPDVVATFEYDFERGYYPDLLDSHWVSDSYWGQPTAEDSPIADEAMLVGLA